MTALIMKGALQRTNKMLFRPIDFCLTRRAAHILKSLEDFHLFWLLIKLSRECVIEVPSKNYKK